MKLIYTDSNEFTHFSWERVVHSLVTFGEIIWINENVTFSNQLPNWLKEHYIKTFNELKEAKIIQLWNYEKYVHNPVNIDAVIPIKESSTLYDVINTQIKVYTPFGTLGQKDISGNEITSKIIQYKHELWNFGIANILNVDGICYPHSNYAKSGTISDYYKYEQVNRKYTEKLFEKFEIKPLGFLSAKDIIDFQKKSSVLTKHLSPYIDNKLTEILPNDETIEKDCNTLFKEYENTINELIVEKSAKKFSKKLIANTIISVVGLVLSPISFVSLGNDIRDYFKNRQKHSLLLFAMGIKDRAYKSYMKIYEQDKDVIRYVDN